MNGHDSRRSRHSRSTSRSSTRNFQRCLLAAALCAHNAPIVTAFGVTSPHTRSKSPTALETSGAHAIPMPVATTTTTATSSHPLELPTFRFPELVEVPTTKQHNKKKKHIRPKPQPRQSTAATTTSGTTTSSTTLSSTTSSTSSSTTSSSTTSTSSTTTTTPWNLLQVSSWDESEIQRRKEEWAGRYTSLDALRSHFGANENKLWGDLQASTARRLYKTLLPRALLELSQLGLQDLNPHDLAPLAYQARVAAKLYARERCTVPARIAATLFDGFRQFQTYGTFRGQGMTYDQIWDKYRTSLSTMMDTDEDHDDVSDEMAEVHPHSLSTRSVPEKDAMTTDVCLKILEKSCVSNSGVDRWVQVPHDYHVRQELDSMVPQPPEDDDRPLMLARALQQRRQQHQQELLERIHAQLEQDMYELLLPDTITDSNTNTNTEDDRSLWNKRGRHKDHVRLVRLLAKQKRLQQRREELGLLTSTTPSSSSSSQHHESAEVLRP